MKRYILIFLIAAIVLVVITLIIELLIIRFNGSPVAAPTIDRTVQKLGSGKPLTYVVMGDSTAISQGSDYQDGFAYASTKLFAENFSLTTLNTAISGATTEDVLHDQLAAAVKLRPDIVLLAAGANDVTHFLATSTTQASVQAIIDQLKTAQPDVQIIVTGSPAVDAVSRFPFGAKQLIGIRTRQVNKIFDDLIRRNDLIHASIAEKTRDRFLADPSLFAPDKFHPNAAGYKLWIPVVNDAVREAATRYTQLR